MEPAAIRYKNPGAMWPGPVATKWGSKRWIYLNDGTGQGGGGHGNKIAIFDTWVQGIAAQLDLWRTSPKYKNKPFSEAIRIWSGGNAVESYINYVLKRVPGMSRGTIMNDTFWKSPMGIAFLKAQSGHEAGRPIPAPAQDWVTAQSLVFGGNVKSVSPANKNLTPIATGTVVAGEATRQGFGIGTVLIVGAVAAIVAFVVLHILQKKYASDLDNEIAKLEAATAPKQPVEALEKPADAGKPPEGTDVEVH